MGFFSWLVAPILANTFFFHPVPVRGSFLSRQLDATAQLTIPTTSGQVTGFINTTAPSVRQFLGIPYAEPPVDSLRFQPPVRKTDAGPINATAFAPSCKQQTSTTDSIYKDVIQEFLVNGGDSEDCLYLNVYAPSSQTNASSSSSSLLPVFIYIPGGGFTSGGADSLYKIPDKWLDRTQAFVAVTMNYRLNLFGYPNARDASQNVGLLDQRMVVEWARDNIAAFGGDPSRMVLWGQSAGAGSSSVYGYGYPDDPIVAGLISDSGAAGMSLTESAGNHTAFDVLAGLVGCGDDVDDDGQDGQGQLECMQKVDAETLTELVSNTSSISFRPVADNVTSFSNITDRISRGLIAKIPVILGNNANEGAAFGTTYNATSPPPESELSAGQATIECSILTEIKNREQFGLVTYRYLYSGNFSNISPWWWIGATHSAELPLIFGTHYEYRGNSTPFEWETSYGMEALWLSFFNDVNTDPTDGNGTTWPKFDPNTATMAEFAANDTWFQLASGSVDDSLVAGLCS